MLKQCIRCGQDFNISPSIVYKRKYCSRGCRTKAGQVELECEYCKKKFLEVLSRVKANRGRFCSGTCRKSAGSQEIVCDNCGKKVRRQNKQCNAKFKFCSPKCHYSYIKGRKRPTKTEVRKVREYCGTVATENTKRLISRQISTQNRCPVCRRYSKENSCKFCSTHNLKRIVKTCKTCGKEFPIKSQIVNVRGRGQYCSQKCRKLGKYMRCLQCNKLFPAHLCEIKKGRKYCNYECYWKSKQTKVETNCQICGTEYPTTRYYKIRGWKKFCSTSCQYKGQMRGENRICKTCKKPFYVRRWEAENGKGVFCSEACVDRGLTTLNDKIRAITKYRKWHAAVLKRDHDRCRNCLRGRHYNKLQVHHIKKLSDIIYEHGVTTVKEALECEALWDQDNAITLCISCHAEVDKNILNMCRK